MKDRYLRACLGVLLFGMGIFSKMAFCETTSGSKKTIVCPYSEGCSEGCWELFYPSDSEPYMKKIDDPQGRKPCEEPPGVKLRSLSLIQWCALFLPEQWVCEDRRWRCDSEHPCEEGAGADAKFQLREGNPAPPAACKICAHSPFPATTRGQEPAYYPPEPYGN